MKIYAIPLTRKVTTYFCDSNIKPSGIVFKLVSKFQQKWDDLSQAKDKTYKKRIYTWGMSVMDKVDHKEWFLKRVPPLIKSQSSETLTILHPTALESSKVKSELVSLVDAQTKHHQKHMYFNGLVIPFTAVISILPLPNIPFFYLAFRLYSHYKAYLGGKHIQYMFKNNIVKVNVDKFLDQTLGSTSVNDKPLDPELIKKLAARLKLPELETEVTRAHKQISIKLT